MYFHPCCFCTFSLHSPVSYRLVYCFVLFVCLIGFWSHVTQAVLKLLIAEDYSKLLILLLTPLECWDGRCVPCPILRRELRLSCLQGKPLPIEPCPQLPNATTSTNPSLLALFLLLSRKWPLKPQCFPGQGISSIDPVSVLTVWAGHFSQAWWVLYKKKRKKERPGALLKE